MCYLSEFYRQYDTFVFPKSKTKPTQIKKSQNFTSWVSGDSSSNFNIPEPSVMRQMCLEIHLISSEELFIEDAPFYDSYDISTATDGLVQLFESCYYQFLLYRQGEHSWCLDSVKLVQKLTKHWLYVLMYL